MIETGNNCALCVEVGGKLLWDDGFCRVILADEVDYPGFCRVILNQHMKEMTDLPTSQQQRLLSVVMAVEKAVRQVMVPDKINLASLGNVVPHLHWHVIPRFVNDAHFPNPIWGDKKREARPRFDSARLEVQLRQVLKQSLS
jgi:diadenosine tetraphosphate (Ap4A) HIT family hydrolase